MRAADLPGNNFGPLKELGFFFQSSSETQTTTIARPQILRLWAGVGGRGKIRRKVMGNQIWSQPEKLRENVISCDGDTKKEDR